MPVIKINNFAGVLPFANPRLLPDNLGTSAHNVDFSRGRLEARYNFLPSSNATVLAEPPQAFLKDNRWVARSPVVDDVHGRWYFLNSSGRLYAVAGDNATYPVGVPVPRVSVSPASVNNLTVGERTSTTVLVSEEEFLKYGWTNPFVENGRLKGTKDGSIQDGTLGAAEYLIREKGVLAASPESITFDALRLAGGPTDGRLVVYTETYTSYDDEGGSTTTTINYAVTAQRLVDLGLATVGAKDGLLYGNITPDVIKANAMSAAELQAAGFNVSEQTAWTLLGQIQSIVFPATPGQPLQHFYSQTEQRGIVGTVQHTVDLYQYNPVTNPGERVYEITISYDTLPADAITEDSRVYAFSAVTKYGEEGALSDPVEVAVEGVIADGGELTFTATLTNLPNNLQSIRVYRPFDGEWRFVTEVPATGTTAGASITVIDTVPNAALGEVAPNLNWTPPPEYLLGFISTAAGYFVGWSGHYVYFSLPYLPHAWPEEYAIALQDNVLGVVETQNGLVVLTNNRVYLLAGGRPEAIQVVPIDTSMPCLDLESAVDMGEYVVYLSREGLVRTDGYKVERFAEDAFPASFFANAILMDVKAARNGDDYLMLLNGTLYALDPQGRASIVPTSTPVVGFDYHTVYARGRGVVLSNGSTVILAASQDRSGDWSWNSKRFSLPSGARSLSALRVVGNEVVGRPSSIDITLNRYNGNTLVASTPVFSGDVTELNNGIRLPAGLYDTFELSILGHNVEVDTIILGTSMLEVRHGG